VTRQPVYLAHDAGSEAERIWRERGPESPWRVDGLRGQGATALPTMALLLIGDGRDDLRQRTIDSFLDKVYGYQLTGIAVVDDRRHEMGFGGAIRAGWHYLRQQEVEALEFGPKRSPFDYVFHLEEDWLFNEPIDVRWLAAILDGIDRGLGSRDFPMLAQAALKRGAVNAQERRAGGVVEQWPDEYRDAGVLTADGAVPYLQHRLFFTTNPSLYRSSLMMLGWPEGAASEAAFTQELLGWGYAFAYYGKRDHPPSIDHIGVQRTGTGY
jgi:hypothetical protein